MSSLISIFLCLTADNLGRGVIRVDGHLSLQEAVLRSLPGVPGDAPPHPLGLHVHPVEVGLVAVVVPLDEQFELETKKLER